MTMPNSVSLFLRTDGTDGSDSVYVEHVDNTGTPQPWFPIWATWAPNQASPTISQLPATSGPGIAMQILAQDAAKSSNDGGGSINLYAGADDGTSVGGTNSGVFVLKKVKGGANIEICAINYRPAGVCGISIGGGTDGVGTGISGAALVSFAELSVACHNIINISSLGLLQTTFLWIKPTDSATGDQQAIQIQYDVSKTTSGDDAGLWINRSGASAPGAQARYVDIWNGGARQGDIRPVGTSTAVELHSEGAPTVVGPGLEVAAAGNVGTGGPGQNYHTMTNGLFIANGTAPNANPTGGAFMFAAGGAIEARGGSGTITTVAPAEPHCPRCGTDFVFSARNAKYGKLTVCFVCLSSALAARGIARDEFLVHDEMNPGDA